MKFKNIYLFVGASGSGKTTIVERLEKQYGLKSIQSYTTRKPRYEGEKGHIFITKKEFSELKDICAYTVFNGNQYGATSAQVNTHELYVIDPKGIEFFKNNYVGNKNWFVIYLNVPIDIRCNRMVKRGDSESKIIERLVNDYKEFYMADVLADIVIENYNLESTIDHIWQFIQEKEG